MTTPIKIIYVRRHNRGFLEMQNKILWYTDPLKSDWHRCFTDDVEEFKQWVLDNFPDYIVEEIESD